MIDLKDKIQKNEFLARIEAALYSAGRPLSLDELSKAAGTPSKEKTKILINELMKKIENTFVSIEIAQLKDENYVFQLKPKYGPLIKKFAQHPLIQTATLKTLSYVLYEQPVTSKRLALIRGSQVYGHLRYLEQMGFIDHENLGRIKVYRTTKKLLDYFGITDVSILKKSILANSDTNKNQNGVKT